MTPATIEDLDSLPAAAFVAELSPLFEGAPAFLGRLAAARPFRDWASLWASADRIAAEMPEAEQIELLDAHPRLGAPPGSVSALSFVEQGYDREAADAAAERERRRVDAELGRLNEAYEQTFGFRYCVFVARRPRAALLAEFEASLTNDRDAELRRGLAAVVRIAQDRAGSPAAAGGGGVMTIELGPNRYGKSAIRLVKVIRDGGRHTIRDLTVDIALEGDFAAAHTAGDNANVVATDTMKNTVYSLAPEHLTGSIERFALTLARHHLGAPQVHRASVTIAEHGWSRMPTADGAADDAFVRRGDMTRTALVSLERDGAVTIAAGIGDLVVMKTGKSSFAGFPRDDYTTLPDTDDRIMATKVTAEWRYTSATAGDASFDYDGAFGRVRDTLLQVMATHRSASVQASIWIVGKAMLEAHAELDEVHLQLPNLHHWLVDLSPFGLQNEREIFVATSQPHGLIDATVRRGG